MRFSILLPLLLIASPVRANVPARYRPAINKGLHYLAQSQNQRTGHWEGNNGQYPIAMTGLAGMALLSEGSTASQGKYAKNIRKARDFLIGQSQPNGLITNPTEGNSGARYMFGHGFALLFLASCYGEEKDAAQRQKLEDVLTRGAKFCRDAQTTKGGWGYVTARDGNDFDEGSVTITQLQALRAARNAGIKVPPEVIKEGVKYLSKSTNSEGGIIYSLHNTGGQATGEGRPALTAAAICCGFSVGEYDNPLIKRWFAFCKPKIPYLSSSNRIGHDEYTHYYYAQTVFMLGEDGWGKLFPNDKGNDALTWKRYREESFNVIVKSQQEDGSWSGSGWTAQFGKVYVTACFLTIMQLDNNALPIYQR